MKAIIKKEVCCRDKYGFKVEKTIFTRNSKPAVKTNKGYNKPAAKRC